MRCAAVVLLALAMAGCGGEGRSGPLAWSGDAQVFEHPTLPEDRILTGMLRNDGLERVRIDVGDVRMLAADGTAVPATPVFLQAFGKSLWSAGRGPEQVPDSELMRTGRIALLKPGEQVPLTVAWHAADGAPARVDWGGGSLAVPSQRAAQSTPDLR
ncbi:MAG: hypothetical protein ACRDPC_13470 [Solirubrobacteraceae bacterium]